MKIRTTLIVIFAATISLQAQSIVIRHDVPDKHYQATIADFPPLATLYKIGVHGTLIDPSWVVTAGHAVFCMEAGDKIKVGNEWAEVDARYTHKAYELGDENDIALLKLKSPVGSVKPAKLYRKFDEANQAIWFIGAGGTGVGTTGQTVSYVDNKGVLRKAQNKIEKATDSELLFIFDKGDDALPLEGVSGNADSGGPAYKLIDGDYYVYGVSSRADSFFKEVGEYGVKEFYSRISYHAKWIDTVKSGDADFIEAQTSQYHFADDSIKDNLPAVCGKIGFDAKS